MTERRVEVGDARLRVETRGAGPALVFVHAGICDARQWDDQWPLFSREWRAVRYDRRGFGATPMPAGRYSHHADLAAVLDALGIERAAFVGCSQGGKTVIDFALEHPRRVAAMVLVASSVSGFAFEAPRWARQEELEAAERAGDLDRVNEIELDYWLDGPDSPPGRVKPAIRARVREMNRIALATPSIGVEVPLDPPAAARSHEITAPALVVIGDLDTTRTQAAATHLAGHLPNARRVTMHGTAHLPNMERVVEFNALASAFLDGAARLAVTVAGRPL